MVLEVRSSPMPDGGIVATLTDITERVKTEETLELRVRERTEELTRVNQALARAKAQAEEANVGKTRFLAGAGHDILQPLNAARLYATSLVERMGNGPDRSIVTNIDASLEAVEDIIAAILDISRLDTGALKPEITTFRLNDVLTSLAVEFAPIAEDKGLALTVMPTSLIVRSDRRLLRRLLQNLIAASPSPSTIPGRALRRHSNARCSRNSSVSTSPPASRADSDSDCRSSNAYRGCSDIGFGWSRSRGRARASRRVCRWRRARPCRSVRQARRQSPPSGLPARWSCASTTTPRSSTA